MKFHFIIMVTSLQATADITLLSNVLQIAPFIPQGSFSADSIWTLRKHHRTISQIKVSCGSFFCRPFTNPPWSLVIVYNYFIWISAHQLSCLDLIRNLHSIRGSCRWIASLAASLFPDLCTTFNTRVSVAFPGRLCNSIFGHGSWSKIIVNSIYWNRKLIK